jgi:hypothetical protein
MHIKNTAFIWKIQTFSDQNLTGMVEKIMIQVTKLLDSSCTGPALLLKYLIRK